MRSGAEVVLFRRCGVLQIRPMPCTSTPVQALTRTDARRPAVVQRFRAIARFDPVRRPGETLADLAPLLDKPKTADRIGMSVSWLDHAFASGEFPKPIYIGRSARWPQAWVDGWISAQVQSQLPLEGTTS